MKAMSNKTIDEIQKSYEYKIDPLNEFKSAFVKYWMLFEQFIDVFQQYKFDENIMELKKKIQMKKDKIEENKFESLDKTLKEIADECKKIDQKVRLDYRGNSAMLALITDNYQLNKDKPGAADVYVKISNDIIDKEVIKYIQYEKKLLSYNDLIIDIKKNLDN